MILRHLLYRNRLSFLLQCTVLLFWTRSSLSGELDPQGPNPRYKGNHLVLIVVYKCQFEVEIFLFTYNLVFKNSVEVI